MADDIKPRLRVPTTAKKGEVVEVKTLITHPMENGQRKDAAGKIVPRLIVNALKVDLQRQAGANVKLEHGGRGQSLHVLLREGRGERARSSSPGPTTKEQLDGREQDRGRLTDERSRPARAAAGRGRDGGAGASTPPALAQRQGADPGTTCCASRRLGQLTHPELHRPACPAHAALFPRAVGQHRRRRGQGPAAAPRRREAAGATSRSARGSADAYALGSDRLRRAGAHLRPHRRARPHGDPDQGDPRRARPGKVLLLDGGDTWQGSYTSLQTKGARHGEGHERAQARRHDRALGIHLRRKRVEGAGQAARSFRSSPAT